ncbi:unnamed protein product [Didymodactylos carnosus]|uniref:FAD-binding PCMH-type domain-containing protein n=2 Tax=Didymodactylos carnosus TaxID=1234261 RepID=A0A813PJC8_9BILA|nr:unnamed protein product [Didymodactylos carnosus]CAF3536437.1 unnamed protein product [Didymodactylos carnosus]
MFIMCLIGLPKFIYYEKRIYPVIKQIIEPLIKRQTLIGIPLYVFIISFLIEIFPFLKQHQKQEINIIVENITISTMSYVIYLTEIKNGLNQYRITSIFSCTLFFFGIYSIITSRWLKFIQHRLSSFFIIIKKYFCYIFISFQLPLSFTIILLLKNLYQLFPVVIHMEKPTFFIFIYHHLFWLILILTCITLTVTKWMKPKQKFKFNNFGEIYVDDISRLNSTRINAIFYPRTINDLQYIVNKAKYNGKHISLRGQAHTMGGQTLPSNHNDYIIDLKYMNRVEYNVENETVLVETGATWAHVIKKLNNYGRSPVVMQSYCTFSVGGTISVNAHGITCDTAMYDSILNIEFIDANGELKQCNLTKNKELFSLLIGGYGLFGIMTKVTLKTVTNIKTSMEYIRLDAEKFPTYYEQFLNDETIEIKIARVDIVHSNNILIFLFRRKLTTSGTIANLNDEARVMNSRQHLIYTWLSQRRLFRRIRFAFEKLFHRPADLVVSDDRNTIMYESAKPMALLYQPFDIIDDTFLLQEYFIPTINFNQWYKNMQKIIHKNYDHLFLLNLTIRFVKKDNLTFLAYTKQNDCFAFVFYFRIKRNKFGDKQAYLIHQELINLAFACNGTFYLPYRQHYTKNQLKYAYPMIDEFFIKKNYYDPMQIFSNLWYQTYGQQNIELITEHVNKQYDKTIDNNELIKLEDEEFIVVEQRRHHSFEHVIIDDVLRHKFRKFLRTVFNVEPPHLLFNYVNRAVRNPSNKNDYDIYKELEIVLNTRQFMFLRRLYVYVKQIIQLRIQMKDILRQQLTIIKYLGYYGQVNDIVGIGDGGRNIKYLRSLLKMKGRTYILHDKQRLGDIIERSSIFPIGTFIPFDISSFDDVPIPSDSIDIVNCYMGLHHLSQNQLKIFLNIIKRILRPNGLFFFREHNAYNELIPLLDVAHSVFNVVTNVEFEQEKCEIRAFRTIEQWRSLLRQSGFEDTFIYDEQEDDPTDDIMLVFRKPIILNLDQQQSQQQNINKSIISDIKIHVTPESNYFRPCEWLVVRITILFGYYLYHTPFYYFPFTKYLSLYWSLCITETQLAINQFGANKVLLSGGFVMNVVAGLILSIFFLQFSFFAFLIRLLAARVDPEYEQLIIKISNEKENNFDFINEIDERIEQVKLLNKDHYALRIPRHRPFSEIIEKLALYDKNVQFDLLFISNENGFIQIELNISKSNSLKWLRQQANINVIYEFKYPSDKDELNQTQIIIQLKIEHLFQFIRQCQLNDKSIKITQVYDYFD